MVGIGVFVFDYKMRWKGGVFIMLRWLESYFWIGRLDGGEL